VKKKPPPLFLGIDTGGTYTDSVLFDPKKNQIIASAKAPTSHGELAFGITESLRGLDFSDFGRVAMVGLSTTLATNAIVERTGRPVGLIVVGYDGEIDIPLSGIRILRVSGGHTVKGEQNSPLDEREVKRFVKTANDEVEAFACASYFSVRNPAHEERVGKIIADYSVKPVVLGHRLSMELDAGVRAKTAALNAGLIPLISSLIESVKKALSAIGVSAPLMVVKGDGSLMAEAVAQVSPIETILSGPAASVVGAGALVPPGDGCDAVIVDIGGTTTDISRISDGRVGLSPRGARVGENRTFVSAVDVRTVGLGGDSRIHYRVGEPISVGPGRILPIARLAERFPRILDTLSRCMKQVNLHDRPLRLCPTDFFTIQERTTAPNLSGHEKDVYEWIAAEPLSLFDVSRIKERFSIEKSIDRLKSLGVVIRVGLTPTDVFNAGGLCEVGDVDASRRAVGVAAGSLGLSGDSFVEGVLKAVRERLTLELLYALLGVEGKADYRDFGMLSVPIGDWLLEEKAKKGVFASVRLEQPIIAVGAPAHVFIGPAAEKLSTGYFVPEDAAVASAVGAVSATVFSTKKAIIRPDTTNFILFTPTERLVLPTYDSARDEARKQLRTLVEDEVTRSGGYDIGTDEQWHESWGGKGDAKILIEAVLTVTAVGRPVAEQIG
jgi:N-methylhydantoinase A/oxoprolinase/acetone carboxylase beta subunit